MILSKLCRRGVLGIMATGWLCAALGQLDSPAIKPENDVRQLYSRAASCQAVVIGKAVKSRIVSKRIARNDLAAMRASVNNPVDGQLFEVEIERIVCHQSDLVPRARTSLQSSPLESIQVAYIFVPEDEPHSQSGYRQEYLLKGERYLLFLVEAPRDLQVKWTAELELDPELRYFRTLEYSRGAVPLPAQAVSPNYATQSPVLERLDKLCSATKAATKGNLDPLKALRNSDDSALKEAASEALQRFTENP